jgi:peptidyl-prolyl cis-trans isomerase D
VSTAFAPYLTSGSDKTVAKVNDNEITANEYNRSLQMQRETMKQRFGESYDLIAQNPEFEKNMRQNVMDNLIQERVIRDEADELGLYFGQTQLLAHIASIEAFHDEDGKFSKETYSKLLRANNYTPKTFQETQMKQMTSQQLWKGVVQSGISLGYEADYRFQLDEQTRTFDALTISASKFQEPEAISDEEIQAEYDKDPSLYQTAEKVRLAYLELSVDALAKDIVIDDSKIAEHYETNKHQYVQAEQRKARHILIASNDDEAAAEQKAQEILAKLESGEDFSELAKANSDDPVSGKKGGDLGWFGRGAMVKPFEDAVFGMSKPGERSGLVKTNYGYHIIELSEIKGADAPPLDEVKDKIVAELQKKQAKNKFVELQARLEELSFEEGQSLDKTAEKLGLTLLTSDWVSQNSGGGIGQEALVRAAAFSDEVLAEKFNSKPIRLNDDRVVVLRVAEHQPAAIKPLVDVKEQIRQQLASEKAVEAVKAFGDKLVEQLKAGESVDDSLAENSLEWQTKAAVKRADAGLGQSIVEKAFGLPRPDNGTPVIDGFALNSGDYAVVVLKEVNLPSAADIDAAKKEQMLERLGQQHGSQEFAAYVDGVKAKSEINVTLNAE